MRAIQQMEAGRTYLIESTASANSVYFETEVMSKLFFRYCDYYLRDYLDVKEYVLNKNGWAMLIKVRSSKTIRKYYKLVEDARKLKDVNLVPQKPKEIWRILSERVRLFISTYARMSNKILGREGSLVRRKYTRYQFDNFDEAKNYVARIRNNQHNMHQPKEKYHGYTEHFRIHGDLMTNPLMSSLWVEIIDREKPIQDKLVEIFGLKMPVLYGLGNLVRPTFKLNKSAEKPSILKPPKP